MGLASLTLTWLLSPPLVHHNNICSTSNNNNSILKWKPSFPPGKQEDVLQLQREFKLDTITRRRRRRKVVTTAVSNLNSGGPLISPQDHWAIWTALFATATFGLWYLLYSLFLFSFLCISFLIMYSYYTPPTTFIFAHLFRIEISFPDVTSPECPTLKKNLILKHESVIVITGNYLYLQRYH